MDLRCLVWDGWALLVALAYAAFSSFFVVRNYTAAATKGDRLQGKVALISGAGAGIGRASALVFAQQGCRVVVADVSEKAGHETVSA